MITNCDHLRHLRFSAARPWAFTEHGAIMAASILKSQRAVEMSVFVVRAFVHLRAVAQAHEEIRSKLEELESRVSGHDEDR